MKPILICLILLVLCSPVFTGDNQPQKEIVLADFESVIPCSDERDTIGFRKKDKMRVVTVEEGAEGSKKSAVFTLLGHEGDSPEIKDLFFQGKVRRMYLSTKSARYEENGLNAFSFWMKLKSDSLLISKNKKNTIGIWTYHWRFGDENVGGKSNMELATDSMMHGYANFAVNEKAADKWVKVVLTPSAFQQSRYYYHFYAAGGTTDDLEFFSSLRQIQFHFFPRISKEEEVQIDELKLIRLEPTAAFEKDFFKAKASKNAGDVEVPVMIKNTTGKDRSYRVFISSFLGVHRNVLYGAHTLTDGFEAPRMMQAEAEGDGGTGVVELIDPKGDSVIEQQREIFIPAKGFWSGKLIHHIKPEMLGPTKSMRYKNYNFYIKRDTLTTSVIVWDPYDEAVKGMDYIDVLPSNADDGNHNPPQGFPKQKRPPKGWRSEDIPINQVGGYFVSVIHLTD
jgi:hypothetical protein